MEQQRFRKVCSKCNNEFIPTGKYEKVCQDCKNAPLSKKKDIRYKELHKEVMILKHKIERYIA